MDLNEELKFLWKFQKKWGGGSWVGGRVGGGGVKVDVNEELKFLRIHKKYSGGGGRGCSGLGAF